MLTTAAQGVPVDSLFETISARLEGGQLTMIELAKLSDLLLNILDRAEFEAAHPDLYKTRTPEGAME